MNGAEILFLVVICAMLGVVAGLLAAMIKGSAETKRREPDEEAEPEWHIDATLIYDKETIYRDCTVQVLENTVTGDVSVGWWRNDGGAVE